MPAPRTAPLGSPDDIEQQFYEALQQGDIEKLMEVWGDDDDIACIHPGGPRIVGPDGIRASFEAMFGNGGGVGAQPERVRRMQLSSGVAIHHVVERVPMLTQQGLQTAWVVATNVYARTARGWRLVLPPASPGSLQDLPDISEPPSTLH